LIGDFGVLAEPNVVVDDAAEVLDEVGVELGGDGFVGRISMSALDAAARARREFARPVAARAQP
jgi:hypothetical protein